MCPAAIHAGTKGPRENFGGEHSDSKVTKKCVLNSRLSIPCEKGAPAPYTQSELGEKFNDKGLMPTILTTRISITPLSFTVQDENRRKITNFNRLLIF